MQILNNFLYPHESVHDNICTHVDIIEGSTVGGFEVEKCILRFLIDNHDHQCKWIWEIWTTAFRFGGRGVYESKELAAEAILQALDK